MSNVIGDLISVESVQEITVQNRLVPTLTLMIQNIRYLNNKNILLLFYNLLHFIYYYFLHIFTIFLQIYYLNFCRHEKLQITLWGELAKNFDENNVR